MNEKQKQLELMGKINKVIKGINTVCKSEDIQHFLYNLNSVITKDPSDSRIFPKGTILYKIVPIKDAEELDKRIFVNTGTNISIFLENTTVTVSSEITITKNKTSSMIIENKLFDMSDKDIKDYYRNKIIEYGQKKIDASRGMLKRQMDLINTLESMVKPVAIKKETQNVVISGHHPAVELYNSPRTRRGHVELNGDRCGCAEGHGHKGNIGD